MNKWKPLAKTLFPNNHKVITSINQIKVGQVFTKDDDLMLLCNIENNKFEFRVVSPLAGTLLANRKQVQIWIDNKMLFGIVEQS